MTDLQELTNKILDFRKKEASLITFDKYSDI